MKKLKVINGILAIFLVLPIWFYIMYQVLDAISATELTWFLYWVYLPVSTIVTFISKVLEND